MNAIFNEVKSKLTQHNTDTGKFNALQIKQETTDNEDHIFRMEEKEPRPSWAHSLMEEVDKLKQQVQERENDQDEGNVFYYNQQGRRAWKNDNQYNNRSKIQCFKCGNFGHKADTCRVQICQKCGKKGHQERNCYSNKHQQKNTKAGQGNQGL